MIRGAIVGIMLAVKRLRLSAVVIRFAKVPRTRVTVLSTAGILRQARSRDKPATTEKITTVTELQIVRIVTVTLILAASASQGARNAV
jgi:hypothetical protein